MQRAATFNLSERESVCINLNHVTDAIIHKKDGELTVEVFIVGRPDKCSYRLKGPDAEQFLARLEAG